MGEWAKMKARGMPIAKAIPHKACVLRAEVLLTLRKHGSTPQASKPSQEGALRHCLVRGYYLIHQASPAPLLSSGTNR